MNKKTFRYQLLVDLPLFYDKSKRAELIYKEWCTLFPSLIDTMEFLADLAKIPHTPVESQIPAEYIDIDFGRGVKWINDNGSECDFFGAIITIETEYHLEEVVPINHIYQEDPNRNDFHHGTKYCVLEGDSSLTEKTIDFLNTIDEGQSMGLLNLYQYPKKILELEEKKPEFLIIDTTLLNTNGITELLKMVTLMQYAPKKIFYLGEVVTTQYPYEKVL